MQLGLGSGSGESLSASTATEAFGFPLPYTTQEQSFDQLQKYINAESGRLVNQHLAFTFYQHKGPGPPRNWEFIQKMKKVVSGYCPNLNQYVLNGMIRIFRHLIRLYDQVYLQRLSEGEGQKRNQRIAAALEKCFTEAKPIPADPCLVSVRNDIIPYVSIIINYHSSVRSHSLFIFTEQYAAPGHGTIQGWYGRVT